MIDAILTNTVLPTHLARVPAAAAANGEALSGGRGSAASDGDFAYGFD